MIYEVVTQLRGEAGARQVKDPGSASRTTSADRARCRA